MGARLQNTALPLTMFTISSDLPQFPHQQTHSMRKIGQCLVFVLLIAGLISATYNGDGSFRQSYQENDSRSTDTHKFSRQDTMDRIIDQFEPDQYADLLDLSFNDLYNNQLYNNQNEEMAPMEPWSYPDEDVLVEDPAMSPNDTQEWMQLLDLSDSSTSTAFNDVDYHHEEAERTERHQDRILPFLKRPVRPGTFPHRKWITQLRKEDVDRIYARLSSTWSDELPIETITYQAKYASNFLQKHPEIVQGLLEGDELVWRTFIHRMEIRPTKKRGQYTSDRSTLTHMVTVLWLAEPMSFDKKEFIIERLSNHWNGASRTLVNGRLDNYTALYGAITSPEPLLYGDNDTFTAAANAIFCEGETKATRHPGAGSDDVLHQGASSSTPTVRKSRFLKLDAARFTSGHEWMQNKSPDEISKIHDAIRAHLVDRISRPTIQNVWLHANDYLELHKYLVERIEQEEDYASWSVAVNCVKRLSQLKDPNRYAH